MITLRPLDGYVNAGESAIITAVLYDPSGVPLTKIAIASLTMAILNQFGEVVNDRGTVAVDEFGNAVITGDDILDVNGGTLDLDGTVTIKLSAADNEFTGQGQTEVHRIQIAWGWTDLQGVPMTGKQYYAIDVRREPASTLQPLAPGWVG